MTALSTDLSGQWSLLSKGNGAFYRNRLQVWCIQGRRLSVIGAVLGLVMCSPPTAARTNKLRNIDHFVVIIEENRSFDNLFGQFPGANGLANAGAAARQVDAEGKPYALLPRVQNASIKPPIPDVRFPAELPNAPFMIDRYVPQGSMTGDLIHRFYVERAQIHGGRMDRFALYSNAGGLTMGYYDARSSALWRLAQTYTLGDNMFHSMYGGSMANHIFLICACVMRWPDAPVEWIARADAANLITAREVVTRDGYVVDTAVSVQFHEPSRLDHRKLVPPQVQPHIGDRLDARGISWKWYAAGSKSAMAGNPDPYFQFHHQPFTYFKNMVPGSVRAQTHLQDLDDLYRDLEHNTLPQIVFYKPDGRTNMHPGYANTSSGDAHLNEVVQRLQASSAWKRMLVIVTYDENGGFWDHVAPPKRDRWGPGTRVPLLLLGPMVKRHFIDHTPYEFASILRTLEKRFNLQPLNRIDAHATTFVNALE